MDTELINDKKTVRRIQSMVSSLPLTCMDFTPLLLHFSPPLPKRCCTEYTMSTFGKVEHHAFSSFSHSQSGLLTWAPYHFFLRSKPWKRPVSSRESSNILSNSEISSFSPINVIAHNMKMIIFLNRYGSQSDSAIIF